MTLFACCIALQCGYLFFLFIRFFFLRQQSSQSVTTLPSPASVIICAKNEAPNLERNLPEILAQRYVNQSGNPHFEVVVVDDGSTDNTQSVLAALSAQHPHLRVVRISGDIKRDLPGKKYALREGLQQAQYPWLVLTDADCRPTSARWIEHMVKPLQAGISIVLGCAPYTFAPGILNAFIRWETLHTLLQYVGYAQVGLPYMAVGRNMACNRAVLESVVVSPVWSVVPSGDDDLLMRIAATKDNTAVVINPDAFMMSPAKRTWSEWLRQKQRHMSTGKYYKMPVQLLLGGYALSHAGIWILAGTLLCTSYASLAVSLLMARCVLYWALWWLAARKIGITRIGRFLPLFDIGWMIYNFVLAPYILWKNKQQWT